MDVVMVVEVQELFSCELCVVIGDDDIRNSKAMVNVGEEQDGLLGALLAWVEPRSTWKICRRL